MGRFATTIFRATQRCNIVATLFQIVTTLFQHCNAVLRKKSSLRIIPCNITLSSARTYKPALFLAGKRDSRCHSTSGFNVNKLSNVKNSIILRPRESVTSFNRRDLEIRGQQRQRQWKRHWKSEFAFFQSSSRLVQVTTFVKCRRTLVKLNSLEPYPSSEREGKFRRRLCISSVQREIGHFHVVVVLWRQRNVQKSVMHV